MSVNLSGRFGLFEMILVVTIVGVLAAAGVKYYGQIMDDSRRVALLTQARAFTAVVAQVHWSWLVKGVNVVQASDQADGAVVIDTMPLFVNKFGWPTHSQKSLHGRPLSALGCKQVWDLIMQNAGDIRIKDSAGLRPDGTLSVSVVDGSVCRFEMLSPSNLLHYFDYSVINGSVDVVTGQKLE
ncbi:hypothetical protein QWY82_15390 [Simiduia curdlanivorans]|uniref:Type II secretion system protein n=1 Tax=Simiduia curdlanivorans TaxID=1492769 RepID=A0ABV8V266_9GAMM|nr:hypothetical protein [Simiduia curdlanivorans]MDN3640178.1 hypothetical protein [Simiduia curdlanivorans]